MDDGQDEYTYQPGEKDYSRSRHFDLAFTAEYVKRAYNLLPVLKPRKGFTYTLLAPATVKGKAAYVIKAVGSVEKMILNPPSWNKGHTMEVFFMPLKIMEKNEEQFYIDQATYHLLQREAKYTQPDNSAKITQLIQSEVFNAPLPDSTFVFVAPQGVKQAEYSVQKVKPRRVGAIK